MFLGRVIGTCVATQKAHGLSGVALRVVQTLDPHLAPVGEPFVAVDPLGAAPGEVVYWVSSREAALALEEAFVPVDAAIVGLVDEVDVLQGRGRHFVRGRSEGGA